MWRRVYIMLIDVSEERRLTQYIHGATFQKTAFFIQNSCQPKLMNSTVKFYCHLAQFNLSAIDGTESELPYD
jgi:hypothetical protein